jgi:hypothetical protein
MKSTLKSQEMVVQDFENQIVSRSARLGHPPSLLVRVLEHHYLNALNFATEEDCKKAL